MLKHLIIKSTHKSINEKIVDLLELSGARFKQVGHPAEGKSEEIAKIRGTSPHQGAKAMLYKITAVGVSRFVLAVLPGDMNVDQARLAAHFSTAKKNLKLATSDEVEAMTGCTIGTVPPFSFNSKISLVVDRRLLEDNKEIAFNAAKFDRSVIMDVQSYREIIEAPDMEEFKATVINFSSEKKPRVTTEAESDASCSSSSAPRPGRSS